ncbi:MAG: N-acetyltransferase [Pedobacter sp.]|nr:MAG: N-acetyltransferase [Pedobacter sp.]
MYESERLLGYSIFNPKLKRVHQLSVDKNFRRKGIGRQLLAYISTNFGEEISVTNIDSSSKEISKFMANIGMKMYIKQYEMELTLK